MTEHKYYSIKQIFESGNYPFTMGQLNFFMLHRHRNGLGKSVRKIGKCCYVRMDLFEQWIEAHTSKEETMFNLENLSDSEKEKAYLLIKRIEDFLAEETPPIKFVALYLSLLNGLTTYAPKEGKILLQNLVDNIEVTGGGRRVSEKSL